MMKDCVKLKRKKERETGGQGADAKKFSGTCNHCGKKGHKEGQCWEKPGNSNKRLAWYNKLKERRELVVQQSNKPTTLNM